MIKTMAVKITEDTYQIAVACLGAGFATTNKECTMGSYLIINDMQYPPYVPLSYGSPTGRIVSDAPVRLRYANARPARSGKELVLENFWMSKKDFKETFRVIGDRTDKTAFFEVDRRR